MEEYVRTQPYNIKRFLFFEKKIFIPGDSDWASHCVKISIVSSHISAQLSSDSLVWIYTMSFLNFNFNIDLELHVQWIQ